jgi:hypothetical protein
MRSEHEYQHDILAGTNALVKGALQVGGVVAGPETFGLGTLALGAVSEGMGKGLDAVLDQYDQSALQSAQSLVGSHLDSLTPSALAEWDSLSELPPDQAQAKALQLVQDWSNSIYGNIEKDPERGAVRDLFNGYLVKALTAQVAKNESINALANQYQQSEIDQNQQNIMSISQTLVAYRTETQSQLTNLQKGQSELQAGLKAVADRVDGLGDQVTQMQGHLDDITTDVGFLKTFAFGKMSPDEQIAALNENIFPNMDEGAKSALIEKIGLVQKQQQLQQDAVNFLNGAQTLIKVGQKFGIDPKVLGIAQDVVGVGAIAEQALSAFASGNYFAGTMNLVSGIFGFGGPDVAAMRQQQIMDRFDSLAKGQQEIMDAENQIMKNQQVLLDGEKTILTSIGNLSDQIRQSDQVIMDKLEQIQAEVMYNRAMIQTSLTQRVLMCRRFLETRAGDPNLYDANTTFSVQFDRFLSYTGLQAHFSWNADTFDECRKGLESNLGTESITSVSLDLRSYDSDGTAGATTYLDHVYTPLLNYTKSHFDTKYNGHLDVLENALAIPSQTTTHSDAKIALIASAGVGQVNYPAERLGTPLSIDALLSYTSYALEIYPYYELVSGTGDSLRLKNLNDTVNAGAPSGRDDRGLLLLGQALKWVDLAIAQESLISGDGILPLLYADLSSNSGSNTDCSQPSNEGLSICLLQTNPLLAQNFVLYGIRQDIKTSGSITAAYALALSMPADPTMLKAVTKMPWNFNWSEQDVHQNGTLVTPKGWSVKLGTRFIALPTADQFMADSMSHRPEMQKLLQTKEKLLDAISDFEVQNQLPDGERAVFGKLLLRGA